MQNIKSIDHIDLFNILKQWDQWNSIKFRHELITEFNFKWNWSYFSDFQLMEFCFHLRDTKKLNQFYFRILEHVK